MLITSLLFLACTTLLLVFDIIENASINQSVIHSFVSNAGSILKVNTVLSKNIASSHHAVQIVQ